MTITTVLPLRDARSLRLIYLPSKLDLTKIFPGVCKYNSESINCVIFICILGCPINKPWLDTKDSIVNTEGMTPPSTHQLKNFHTLFLQLSIKYNGASSGKPVKIYI